MLAYLCILFLCLVGDLLFITQIKRKPSSYFVPDWSEEFELRRSVKEISRTLGLQFSWRVELYIPE